MSVPKYTPNYFDNFTIPQLESYIQQHTQILQDAKDRLAQLKARLKLNPKKKMVWEVDYNDLDRFVNAIYPGLNFEFVAIHEAANYSSYSFKVQIPKELRDIHLRIKAGTIQVLQTRALFELLAYEGHLEAGDYIIKVYW